MYEGDDSNFTGGTPPEESSNRTFIIAAAVLGGIVLLSLACLAIFVVTGFPGTSTAQQQAQQATVVAQNTQVSQALTQTAVAAALSLTPQASPVPTNTPQPSPTPVVSIPTETPAPALGGGATATVAAALTQAALAAQTIVPTSTGLPATGFADEVGLPGLFILTLVFIAVILLSRRLRTTPAR